MRKKGRAQTESENIAGGLYDAARVGTRIAYTTLPAAAYAVTSDKLAEIDGFNWFKKLLAYVFYRGDISRLNELNDHAAKASGASAALFTGYAIDRATEAMFPNSKGIRKVLQPLGDFVAASAVNAAVHGANSLEGLVGDTLVRTGDVIHNIASTGNASDGEYFLNTGIATLTSLALVKGVNNLLVKSGIASATYQFGKEVVNSALYPLKLLYNATLGDASDKYETRRIKSNLKRKAGRKFNKDVKKIEQDIY